MFNRIKPEKWDAGIDEASFILLAHIPLENTNLLKNTNGEQHHRRSQRGAAPPPN